MKRQDGEHGLFERLSETLTDPYVDRMFLRARELESAIEQATEDEQAAVAKLHFDQLDRDWIYKEVPLDVTGLLYGINDGELIQRRVANKQMLSRGFIFERREMVVDDEVILGNWRAALHLIDQDADEDEPRAYNLFLGDIDHIEYPFPSRELRVVRFNYHHPEAANELFTKIYDSATDNDIIYALKDYYFDMNERFEDDNEELADLTAYVNEIADFDNDVPWRFVVVGEVGVMHDDGAIKVAEIKSATHWYGKMHAVMFMSFSRNGDTSGTTKRKFPVVAATLHAKDKGRPDIEAYIPFTSIAEIEGLR